MNPEVKAKWVAALRSGEYPQTLGQLRRTEPAMFFSEPAPPGFCCLGVLSDLYHKENGGRFVGQTAVPSQKVREWAGLALDFETSDGSLWTLNDTKRWSFERIADVIERDL